MSVLVIAQDSLHDEIGDEHRNLPYYRPTLLAKYSELVDLGNVNIEWQEALSLLIKYSVFAFQCSDVQTWGWTSFGIFLLISTCR